MNESALNALINLFAVFSVNGGKDYDSSRSDLEDYLILRLGIREPAEYVALFYEIYDLYSIGPQVLTDDKALEIAGAIGNRIKSKIHHRDQVLLFLHFLELTDREIIQAKRSLYKRVADIFEIRAQDFSAFENFIFCSRANEILEPGFLVINSQPTGYHAAVYHRQNESLQGELLIYFIAEIDQFIFKYFGEEPLSLEGNSIRSNRFYVFNQGRVIRNLNKTNIYYTDLSLVFFKDQRKDPITFTGDTISFHFPKSRGGIQTFTFSENSGQMIAVMGGSGVGKSTLLNVLNGRLPLASGKLTINGFDIHDEYEKIEGLIGYIPQDDIVNEELTVYQNVYFSAQLCLSNLSAQEIQVQVERILKELDLYEVKDMMVGNPLKKFLSGGQRKRLNIALELIREPSILFVDEPTSGLSSKDSEKIMILLKQQANQGRLIIVNIHQPSSFIYKLFDKLWIFDRGGYPVYAGNPLDAVLYFKKLANHVDAGQCECDACGNVNPEQVLEIIETETFDESGKPTGERKYSAEELNRIYREEIQDSVMPIHQHGAEIRSSFVKPPVFSQFKVFFARNIKAKFSNHQYVIINLLQAPLLALVVSLLTRYSADQGYSFGLNKNLPSFIFMSIVVMLFQGMSLSAEEIYRDRNILQRESFLRLSRLSYLNSKILFLMVLSLIQSFLFLVVSVLVLKIGGLFLSYWIILFLTAFFANMVGLNISSGLNSVVTIYISIPLLIIPQILLCGLIVPFDDLKKGNARNNNVPVIGDLMASRWAFEALAVEQTTRNKYDVHYYPIEKEMSEYFIKGELIIPRLSNLVQSVHYTLPEKRGELSRDRKFEIIRKELQSLDLDGHTAPFLETTKLNASDFTRAIGDSLVSHLTVLRDLYKELYRSAEGYKDDLTNKLVGTMGVDQLLGLKTRHHNSALASIVVNERAADLIVTGHDRFLIKVAPIYRDPDGNNGRAHFYSPVKKLGSMVFTTLGFNSAMLILMIIFLYTALYYDWLKKLLDFRMPAGWKKGLRL
jgi:ABC-type multidrug transport system ATPase subunit